MGDLSSYKIQIVSIIGSLLFMYFIFRLIIKGKLREEYSIIWIIGTFVLILFSVWREGIGYIAELFGVYYPPSLIFLGGFFSIVIFLVHFSLVNSRHHRQIKELAHEIALLKKKLNQIENNKS